MVETTVTQTATTPSDVIGFLEGEFLRAVSNLPTSVLAMTLDELEMARTPTEIDYFLRKRLWKLIETAQKTGDTVIKAPSIYKGICSSQNFNERVLTMPLRVAWIIIPPHADMARNEEALHFGIGRIRRELLTMPMNEKTAPSILKAVEMLANRVWGPIVQKVEAKHAHLNLNKPVAAASPADPARLEHLREKLTAVRDVTPGGDKSE